MWHPNIEFLCVASLFQNDSKLSHGWFLVHWLSPDSSQAGLARTVAKFHRFFQWLADQSEVDLWHQNFQNEIEQTIPTSCVHLQHPRRKLHKFFCMFVLRFYLFCSKKASHSVFLQEFHSFSNITFDMIDELPNFVYKKCNLKCHLSDARSFDTIGLVLPDMTINTI